jgi:hypothetical protein
MNRIRDGCVSWRNPFGGKQCEASLSPDDVSAIVFWSKNFAPLVPYMDELDRQGYRYLFHFTITGLPTIFEPRVPPSEVTIPTARMLAERYSPDAVLWRYDPIVISDITSIDYHRNRFRALAAAMEGITRRCYFSFPTFYGKVVRNSERLTRETGIICQNPPLDARLELANELAEVALQHGIEMHACCDDSLVQGRIKKAHCIDGKLLLRLYPDKMRAFRLNPTRKQCGCYESKDIGAYDTCPHECFYCYANCNKDVAERHWKEHQI